MKNLHDPFAPYRDKLSPEDYTLLLENFIYQTVEKRGSYHFDKGDFWAEVNYGLHLTIKETNGEVD